MRLSQRVHNLMASDSKCSRCWVLDASCILPCAYTSLTSFVSRNLIYWNRSFFMMLFIYWQTHSATSAFHQHHLGRGERAWFFVSDAYPPYTSSLPSFLVILLSLFCVSRVNGKKADERWKMRSNANNDKANTKNSYTQKIYIKHYLYYPKQTVGNAHAIEKKTENEEIFYHEFLFFVVGCQFPLPHRYIRWYSFYFSSARRVYAIISHSYFSFAKL